MKLILASNSPRRAEILRAAGFEFEVAAPDVDESRHPGESAEEMVQRLALAKARWVAVARTTQEREIVLSADTVVVLDEKILGKPGSAELAREMLRDLRGREHRVITGIAAVDLPSEKTAVSAEITRVWFSAMTDIEIEEYVLSGEPFDKAGGYAIQGFASRYIPRIEGCYFNVVGLPIARVTEILRQLGYCD